MIIFPAIDIIDGQAVRLVKGDYSKKTIYNTSVSNQAKEFEALGATHLHLVDLDGAKSGQAENFDAIKSIRNSTNMFLELGGGVRTFETIEKYINLGINRVILGTAAVKDEELLRFAAKKFPENIAVGADAKNGKIAINGWLEESDLPLEDFCKKLSQIGIQTVICTDISKDGLLSGTNLELYKSLSKFNINLTASGGVSTIDDVKALRKLNIYAAIIGKAYYEKRIDLKEAIEVAK